jgi:hypothetical protein
MNEFYTNEKPALVLTMNPSGNDGTVFVSNGGSYAKDAPVGPAMVMLSSDDYLRIQRLVESGVKVNVEADVKTKFYTDDLKGYNVVAEIPGTDPTLKEQLVMLGGHLDSWQRSDDGSSAHFESDRRTAKKNHPHCFVERRRRRLVRQP